MTAQAVVWFRRDLRLGDNPAWAAASQRADRVTALYVLDPILLAAAGDFRRHQLLAHLHALDLGLQAEGGRLLVRHGDATEVVPEVAAACGAATVYANADVTPYAHRRDESVKSTLGEHFQRWWGTLMHPPGSVTTNKGHTSHVFTPFFTRWSGLPLPRWPQPVRVQIADDMGDGLPVMVSRPFQAGGEQAAMGRLFEFAEKVDEYEETRNRPNLSGTSCLSADLHFGVLAPRTVAAVVGTSTRGRAAFVRQLAWRDWYAHLLREMPRLVDTPLRADSIELAWQNDATVLEAWQNGLTGYPLVDAGIRQLRATGWMHNRVRMVVASFLVKDLLVDWRIGERWFRRCLVDGDIAQNTGNWQWIAGTGPDAAPYFRVFNPVLQSRKFDPEGTYIRRFVPELAAVPSKWIHAPWAAPPMDLALFGVTLGDTYPYPIVDHTFARERALGAHQATRQGPLK